MKRSILWAAVVALISSGVLSYFYIYTQKVPDYYNWPNLGVTTLSATYKGKNTLLKSDLYGSSVKNGEEEEVILIRNQDYKPWLMFYIKKLNKRVIWRDMFEMKGNDWVPVEEYTGGRNDTQVLLKHKFDLVLSE